VSTHETDKRNLFEASAGALAHKIAIVFPMDMGGLNEGPFAKRLSDREWSLGAHDVTSVRYQGSVGSTQEARHRNHACRAADPILRDHKYTTEKYSMFSCVLHEENP
jgi:hypothetical protein